MRQWTENDGRIILAWIDTVPWLQRHRDHNLRVIPRFFEAHPQMPVTFETLNLAVQSAEILPDPYRPNTLDRLRIGEIVPPPPPQPWSEALASRPTPALEKPKPLNAPRLPSHNDKTWTNPGWFRRVVDAAEADARKAEIENLRARVRSLRTLETRDNLPIKGTEI
jgi:hypothetical protein